ncbi:MAG: sulfite exporter TauE/SafE family protein [Magnetococcales bacterium]|nr:sulfite exporter TauE/SafE family protein [Magnetococcales bacterium]
MVELFLVGLLGTTHCLVMCGAVVGALTLSLPVAVRQRSGALLRYLAAYNGGRLVSYILAGYLAGASGEMLIRLLGIDQQRSPVLLVVSGILLIGMGLHVGGWLRGIARLERLGYGLWRILEPLAQSLLPVATLGRALVFGLIWGWFPCGLTYTVLLWSATSGDGPAGALAMAAFGLGTLPGLFAAGLFAGRLLPAFRSHRLRQGLGVAIILMALAMGWWGMQRNATPVRHGDHPEVGLSRVQ